MWVINLWNKQVSQSISKLLELTSGRYIVYNNIYDSYLYIVILLIVQTRGRRKHELY